MHKRTIAEYLAEFDARQRTAQLERRAGAPMCGVFWFIPSDQGSKIVADGSTLREAEETQQSQCGLAVASRLNHQLKLAGQPSQKANAEPAEAETGLILLSL